MSGLDRERIFFNRVPLKVAIVTVMFVELAVCFIFAILGMAYASNGYVFFQLAEGMVAATVLVAVQKGKTQLLLVYLCYNLADIAYQQISTVYVVSTSIQWLPWKEADLDVLNQYLTHVILRVFLVVTITENVYLIFAGTTWWIVLRTFGVMKEHDALSASVGQGGGGQFAHHRFDINSGTLGGTVGSDAGSTISSSEGGGITNPAFKGSAVLNTG